MTKEEEAHFLALGQLVSNLQSLEFLLRVFHAYIRDTDSSGNLPGMPQGSIARFAVGQQVPENHLTNYDSLGMLIEKYNRYVDSKGQPSLCVDTNVVELRDALFHGRVFSDVQDSPPSSLVKFDRPSHGQVSVVFSATITPNWFTIQIRCVFNQLRNVIQACKLFAPRSEVEQIPNQDRQSP